MNTGVVWKRFRRRFHHNYLACMRLFCPLDTISAKIFWGIVRKHGNEYKRRL